MSTATLTSKRQITIPSDVAKRLGVGVGDRIQFVETASGDFLLRPVTTDITSLKGIIGLPKRPASLEEMDKAIAKSAAVGASRRK
jgi:AbrB family looped-hinge helix DNA binding protein